MPKLTCLCWENINLSLIPNPQGFKLVWENINELNVITCLFYFLVTKPIIPPGFSSLKEYPLDILIFH